MRWIQIVCFFFLIIYRINSVYIPSHNRHSQLQEILSDSQQITQNEDDDNVCLTSGCMKAASDILSNLDETVDPCDDFYQFACGGWLNRHSIAGDRTSVSVFTDIQDDLNSKLRGLLEEESTVSDPNFIRMVKDFYSSCMDMDKIETLGSEPLQKALQVLGGWPVVEGGNWDGSNFNWLDTLINLGKLGYSHNTLFTLTVGADLRENTVHILYLGQAALGMPDRSYLLKGLEDSTTAAYFKLMVKSAVKLGANEETAERELRDALNFEISLAQFSLPDEETRDFNRIYNKYSVGKLQDLVPHIDWMKYFNGFITDPVFLNDTVLVMVPEFVIKLSELLQTADSRTIANYMMWRVVKQTLSLLSREYRDLNEEYQIVLSGRNKEIPRWEQCLASTSSELDVALSSYYVRHYFKGDSKDRALEMVKYLQNEFLNILDNIDWMDESTKTNAKEKANAIKPYIGYPQELLNDTLVLKLYEKLTITGDGYYDNIFALKKWANDYVFSHLRKPNIKGEWMSQANAIQVNAFYNAMENSIVFPAGILQNALFNKDRPNYMNFGAIGFIIGHEITHGFDDTGRQFDKDGINANWWEATTDYHFTEKARCIIEQYGNYTIENGLHVNGRNTQGENIADNGGLKEAYLAYQSWVEEHGQEPQLPGLKYTANQMFWISAANAWCTKVRPESLNLLMVTDNHSPAQFRVIGPMSNLPEFSREFFCELGSPMNPRKKCQVW